MRRDHLEGEESRAEQSKEGGREGRSPQDREEEEEEGWEAVEGERERDNSTSEDRVRC